MDALQIFLGKPRKPSTPGTVAISTLINAGIVAWIIFGWPS